MGRYEHMFKTLGNGNCHRCGSKPVKITNCRDAFVGLYCSNEECECSFNNTMERINKNRKCYIATAVYGSYDCPQVLILRYYRDNTLANNFFGRIFIKIYYYISPIILIIFGKSNWFIKFSRNLLDKIIHKLVND